MNEESNPRSPPPPATGQTFRCPMLLSNGTTRHSGVGPVALGKKVAGSILLRSAAELTSMNMHSCPTFIGFHLNGPTITSPAAGILATFNCGVSIGFQSPGQLKPAAGSP